MQKFKQGRVNVRKQQQSKGVHKDIIQHTEGKKNMATQIPNPEEQF